MLILDSHSGSFSEPNTSFQVVSSDVHRSFPARKILLYSSVFLGVGILIVPAVFALANGVTPTGTYLDPRPQHEMAMAPTPTATPDSATLILSAQAFLEKAITASAKPDQTPVDKQQIIALLNQSLDYSNQAVLSSPHSPQTYLIRARVLTSSSSIRADAMQLAQRDLEFAQKLSGGQPVDLPTQVNLLDISPTGQASLASNVTIAAPNEATSTSTTTATNSNVSKSQATIPAGKSEVTIHNTAVTADNYLYIINTTDTTPIYIKSKDVGSAIISTMAPATTPITFEFWLVKP